MAPPEELEGAEGAAAGLLLSFWISLSISAIFLLMASMLALTPSTCSVIVAVISFLNSLTEFVRALSVSSIFLSVFFVNSSICAFWEMSMFFISLKPLIIFAMSSWATLAIARRSSEGARPLWH